MKFGKHRPELNVETVIIPRSSGNDLVFRCQAVINEQDFIKNFPPPEAPTIKYPNGETRKDISDEAYIRLRDAYAESKFNWMVLESLKATPDLEWETVDSSNPTTWGNYKKELQEFNITEREVMLIITGVLSVNSLDETKLEEARNRFLAGQGQEAKV
jgi:hypothetical protein